MAAAVARCLYPCQSVIPDRLHGVGRVSWVVIERRFLETCRAIDGHTPISRNPALEVGCCYWGNTANVLPSKVADGDRGE